MDFWGMFSAVLHLLWILNLCISGYTTHIPTPLFTICKSVNFFRYLLQAVMRPLLRSTSELHILEHLRELQWIGNSVDKCKIDALFSFLKMSPSSQKLYITVSVFQLYGLEKFWITLSIHYSLLQHLLCNPFIMPFTLSLKFADWSYKLLWPEHKVNT